MNIRQGAKPSYPGQVRRACTVLPGKRAAIAAVIFLAVMALPGIAFAQDSEIDSGDTAWMLTSMVLVLFMTIPGLALFYGGLVRSKNVLSVLMQCFGITCLVTILWTLYAYSLAFDDSTLVTNEAGETVFAFPSSFVGGLSKVFVNPNNIGGLSGTIPESVFFCFQLTFAIITPALVVGAFAERMKFSAVLIFTGIWVTVVYAPICHMVWGGGLLSLWGAMDFAGGTVVHINAGVAALVACLMVGKRSGFPKTPMPPHNVAMCVTGAAMLWVGWFGFNAGSQLAADITAGMAMLVTQVATAMAAFTWMMCEWIKHGKPSAVGIATGAVAGLVAITPASGYVGPIGALVIGLAAGVVCFVAATTVKNALGYDDSLDAFGVHAVGGVVGALLTGIFAANTLGAFSGTVADIDIVKQFGIQCAAVAFTILWCGVWSFLILKGIDVTIGLRVDEEEEIEGLDISLHSESGYNL